MPNLSGSTFDSTKTFLTELLKDAEKGALQLPDFQRGWVWDDEHIRDLLASISMGFPIGTLMLLESGGENIRFKTRPVEGAELNGEEAERLILDGQQRLTSLFQALYTGKPVVTRDARGKRLVRWYYMDIVRALDPSSERVDAILSIPEDRVIRTNFGRDIQADFSSEEGEFAAKVFPLSRMFDPNPWKSAFNRHWDYEGPSSGP